MRRLALIVALLIASGASVTAEVPATIASLTEPVVLRAGDGVSIVVSVTNLTARPIVASQVNFAFRARDGSKRGATVACDAYLQLDGQPLAAVGRHAKPTPQIIAPGGTASFRSQRQTDVDQDSVVASLRYVVFDDGSWVGDARAVEGVFDIRASEALAWRHVASVLETARRGGDARHALDVARRSLNTDPPGDSFTAHRVRDTIKQALDDSRQPLNADGLVQRLIEIATLNAVAGEKYQP